MPSLLAPPHCHSLHLPLQFSHSRGPVSKHKRTLLSPPHLTDHHALGLLSFQHPWCLTAVLLHSLCPQSHPPPPAWERADLRIYILQLHPPYHKAPVPPGPLVIFTLLPSRAGRTPMGPQGPTWRPLPVPPASLSESTPHGVVTSHPVFQTVIVEFKRLFLG